MEHNFVSVVAKRNNAESEIDCVGNERFLGPMVASSAEHDGMKGMQGKKDIDFLVSSRVG